MLKIFNNTETFLSFILPKTPKIVLLALLYFVFGKICTLTAVSNSIITPVFFIPEGISLAFAILFGPVVGGLGTFLGQLFLALSGDGSSLSVSLLIALSNGSEAVLGWWLFNKLKINPNFEESSDLTKLCFMVAGALQMFSASMGVLILFGAGIIPSKEAMLGAWLNWYISNVMAQLVH